MSPANTPPDTPRVTSSAEVEVMSRKQDLLIDYVEGRARSTHFSLAVEIATATDAATITCFFRTMNKAKQLFDHRKCMPTYPK